MKKILFTLLTLCLCGTTWAYDFSAEVTNKDGSSTTFYFSYNVDEDGNHVTTIIDGTEYQTVEVRSKSTSTDTLFDYTDTYSGELTIPATVDYNETTYAVTGLGHNSIRTSSLTKLTIPSTIQYIGTMAVYNCKSLKDVIIEYAETPLEIRCTDTNSLPAFGYSQIVTLELDRDLTIVDSPYSTPFYNNTYIQNVIIGENVKELTAHAFEGCTALTEVTVSNMKSCKLTTIGSEAFMKCSSLTHITIPASVTTFGNDCFMSCTNLRNVFLLATDPSEETLSGDDFQSDTNVTLYVPRGTAAAYYASEWQEKVVSRGNVSFNFYNLTTISEDTQYTDEADENNTYYYATYYYDGEGEENYTYEVDDTSKTLYAVTGVDEGVVKMEALSGDIIPKNTPLLIESSTPGAYYMWRNYYDDENNPFYEDGTPTTISNVPTNNILYGHSTAGNTSANNGTYNSSKVDGYKFYKLSLDSEGTEGSIGFYYGAEGGASYNAGANRCWLAVSDTEATNLSYLSFKKDNGDTTGISSVESAVESVSVKGIYTIQGVRVSNMNQPGLYIVDGKKVLVK